MLGGAFVNKWANHCVALVRNSVPLTCHLIQADLSEPTSIVAAVKKVRPSICFHFAACTDLTYCEQNPKYAEKINGTATAVLAEICASMGTRVIYMCTDSIFDGKSGNYAETDIPAPLNFYARSKLSGEQATLAASNRNISIRGNIFGTQDRHDSPKLYDWVVKSLRIQQPITGFADVFFNPIGVNTLSEILAKMVQVNLSGGCWHVGTRNPISKDSFIRLVARSTGLSDGCVTSGSQGHLGLQPPRPLNTTLKTLKLEAVGMKMPTIESELQSIAEKT